MREAVAPLDGYYIPTRYPSGLPDSIPAHVYTRKAAEETLRMADQVLEVVRRKLGIVADVDFGLQERNGRKIDG